MGGRKLLARLIVYVYNIYKGRSMYIKGAKGLAPASAGKRVSSTYTVYVYVDLQRNGRDGGRGRDLGYRICAGGVSNRKWEVPQPTTKSQIFFEKIFQSYFPAPAP